MESELQKFRRRKQLEQTKEEIKSKIKATASSWIDTLCVALLPNWNDNVDGEEGSECEEVPEDGLRSSDRDPGPASSLEEPSSNDNRNKWLMYLITFLRFLAWVLVYIGFVKIGFGAVFFTISLLIFIYLNTRKERKRRKGEVSAYSVFNKDCEAINGTLNAEQLEKQLLYRS